METFNSTDLNFSDSAIEHFSKVLKERGKGIGIKLGIKEAGCSGYEYTFDFVDDIIDDLDQALNKSSKGTLKAVS